MADTQGSTTSKRGTRAIEGARSKVEKYDFGVDTADELHSRLEAGDSHPTDAQMMCADIRAILNGAHGDPARLGFTETLLKIATRNVHA